MYFNTNYWFRLKNALQAVNLTSSSNELEDFFKIIVRMGKENEISLELGNNNEKLFQMEEDRMNRPKINYWKNKAIKINLLFEKLGLANITSLMKNVSSFQYETSYMYMTLEDFFSMTLTNRIISIFMIFRSCQIVQILFANVGGKGNWKIAQGYLMCEKQTMGSAVLSIR